MNASFTCISLLGVNKLPIKVMYSFLNELSSKALRCYLGLASIYDGNANKKKSELTEIIVHGYINNELKNKVTEDYECDKALKLVKSKGINVKSLPAHGNMDMKKADILKKHAKNN